MKLKEFIDNLNQFVKEHPETAEFLVVSANDDEGSGFTPIHYTLAVGNYNEYGCNFTEDLEANAICVN
jgi:cytochrome b involved in lipid metabolism